MNKSQEPFFSILTASYNSGSTIKDTLSSVSEQIFESYQHIVVDGGSNDDTLQYLNLFSSNNKLRWISEPDKGIADALNKALKMASGKYIIVIQADDQLLSSNTLEAVYTITRDQQYDIYSFPVVYNSHIDGKVLHKPISSLWWNHFKFIFLHQGAFVHKRVFQNIGGFNDTFKIAMDYDFFYRALAQDCSVRFETMPVALMGGDGIGSRVSTLVKRLEEEARVQELNEGQPFWRLAQALFRTCYVPYKTRFLPWLNRARQ